MSHTLENIKSRMGALGVTADVLVLVAALIAGTGLGMLRFDSFQVGTFTDDAHYVVLAESLATGQGYRLINFPVAREEWAFPPGWPLLLAPLAAVFPGDYNALKLLPFLLWLGSILVMYRLFRMYLPRPYWQICLLLSSVNPTLIGTSGMLMSESSFLFFSLLALVLYKSWASVTPERGNRYFFMLMLVVASYVPFIRTIGLALLISIAVSLALSGRLRESVIAAMWFLAGLVPQIWINSGNGLAFISPGYQSQVFDGTIVAKIGQMWANALAYCDELIASSIVPVFGPNIARAIDGLKIGFVAPLANALILLMIGIGACRSARKLLPISIHALIYLLGILLFWNPDVGSAQSRFLVPLVPILYIFLIRGASWLLTLVRRLAEKHQSAIVVVAACLVMLVSLARNVQDWRNPVRDRITDLSIGTEWIQENAAPDAIIMARDPVPDYIHARRKTVPYPVEGASLEDYVRANGVDYIMVRPKLQTPRTTELGEFIDTHLLPLLQADQARYTLVYQNSTHNVSIYQCND